MAEGEFNLLDEPWILALNQGGGAEELSLIGVLERAHELTSLAGELPTQDVALLRLLLATLHATFTKADENGGSAPLKSREDALFRWKRLWALGRFPMNPIKRRLMHYHDRFYLFHPERPFYQAPGLSKGTDYMVAKLMGNLSESSNKVRLFQVRTGAAKKALTNAEYGEAARWLLYLNAFDDTSSKPTRVSGQKLPSPGAGWLGKLGLVYAVGENLFETLMLNFTLLNGKEEPWDDGLAAWETDSVKMDERTEIPVPNSQTELLTLQSRRLLLERKGTDIVGYKLLGGDFFPKENSFSEQMTLWRRDTESREEIYTPKRHDASKQLWRDFAALASKHEASRPPGVISWLALLEDENLIPEKTIKIQAASVKYGDKDFFVDDIWGDSIAVNAAVLSTFGEGWVIRIVNLLQMTDKCVRSLGYLAVDLARASGETDKDKKKDGKKNSAMEEAYFRLDNPFRSWLSAIKPKSDDIDEKDSEWRDQVRRIVLDLGETLVINAGSKAFVGKESVNAPKAYAKFRGYVNSILNK